MRLNMRLAAGILVLMMSGCVATTPIVPPIKTNSIVYPADMIAKCDVSASCKQAATPEEVLIRASECLHGFSQCSARHNALVEILLVE